MRTNKILIILQLCLMYISQACILIGGLVVFDDNATLQEVMNLLFRSGVIIALATTVLSIGILVPAIISIFKKNNEDMTRFTMIIKLAAIPWYIMNFVLCTMLVAGMLNPFLVLGIPIMVFIFVCITYINMFVVSANNVAGIIGQLKDRTLKINPLLIVGVIFHFIFCLDILGAIFTYANHRKVI